MMRRIQWTPVIVGVVAKITLAGLFGPVARLSLFAPNDVPFWDC